MFCWYSVRYSVYGWEYTKENIILHLNYEWDSKSIFLPISNCYIIICHRWKILSKIPIQFHKTIQWKIYYWLLNSHTFVLCPHFKRKMYAIDENHCLLFRLTFTEPEYGRKLDAQEHHKTNGIQMNIALYT